MTRDCQYRCENLLWSFYHPGLWDEVSKCDRSLCLGRISLLCSGKWRGCRASVSTISWEWPKTTAAIFDFWQPGLRSWTPAMSLCLPRHDGLWDSAEATAHDLKANWLLSTVFTRSVSSSFTSPLLAALKLTSNDSSTGFNECYFGSLVRSVCVCILHKLLTQWCCKSSISFNNNGFVTMMLWECFRMCFSYTLASSW